MEKEIDFLETINTLVWNNISKQELILLLEERKETLKKQKAVCEICESEKISHLMGQLMSRKR